MTPNSIPKFRDERGMINAKLNNQQMMEQKVKRSNQRPYSGGIQKMIKTESSNKSRVQNLKQSQNYSMYESGKGQQAQSNSQILAQSRSKESMNWP